MFPKPSQKRKIVLPADNKQFGTKVKNLPGGGGAGVRKEDSTVGSGRIIGYILDGKETYIGAGNRTLADILKKFTDRDATFMPRFAASTRGSTRRLVATEREDLYDQKDLTVYSVNLENGWWLGTHLSGRGIRKYIKVACNVANVRFGSQLILLIQ